MVSYLTVVNRMKEEYRQKLLKGNEWIDGTDKFGLTLTDDLDSLLSCAILKQIKGWNIESAFIFNDNKVHEKDKQKLDCYYKIADTKNEQIGVDFAKAEGKCFDNHLTQFTFHEEINPQAINLNRVQNIYREKYCKKYNLSTVLLLWSLYDLPKEKLTDELMMLLIAIDSSDAGFYTDKRWVGIHEYWINEVLDLPELLEFERSHTKEDFNKFKRELGLVKGRSKIWVEDKKLCTDIDLEAVNEILWWNTDIEIKLPEVEFYRNGIYKDNIVNIQGFPSSIKAICDNPFSYAMTSKYAVAVSEQVM